MCRVKKKIILINDVLLLAFFYKECSKESPFQKKAATAIRLFMVGTIPVILVGTTLLFSKGTGF
jgi:hypothetical protein